MVLPGFIYASWIGWISGSYFVSKPWGTPTYNWLSLYTLYALVFNVFSAVKWVHFIHKAISFLDNQSLSSKILNLCLLVGACLFGSISKIIFFLRAKCLIKFLHQLRTAEQLIEPEVLTVWKWCKVLICTTCIYQIGAAFALPFFFYRLIPDASFSFLISPYYFIVFFIFGSFPLTTISTVSYIFTLVVTFHLLFIIEKLFADLNQWVQNQTKDKKSGSITVSLERTTYQSVAINKDFTKEEIIRQIENIQSLCKQFDHIVGPLILFIFIRTVFFLIHSADAILIEGSPKDGEEFSDFKRFFGWVHLCFESTQLSLIFVGNFFHGRMALRKQQLETSVFLHPAAGKRDIEEIWTFVKAWKWKLTACGIFVVDKPLIAGVVSTMMTYVVILFQVNLSDPGAYNGTSCIAN